MDKVRIAVVGLGPAGLTALKNLREEGFDAVAFERRDQVGGVWSYSPDTSYTSVIRETVSNISKFVSGFSDFPMPKEYPPYLSGSQVAEYFQSYARHFGLEPHIRFNSTVKRVTRDEARGAWRLRIAGPDGESDALFDKVVFGTGSETKAVWPAMPGRDKFKGVVMHGQNYRSPAPLAGKRVLVVGIGNTACDVSLSLAGHAAALYQSYRRGRLMVSRYLDDGVPTDSTIPWPALRLKYLLDRAVPRLSFWLADGLMRRKMVRDAARSEPAAAPGESDRSRRRRARRRLETDFRLRPAGAPSLAHDHPAVQEDFVPLLYAGGVAPVAGFEAFVGPDAVLLADGSVLRVDAVVFCTGYAHDFGLMPDLEMDGACGLPTTTPRGLADARDGGPSKEEKGGGEGREEEEEKKKKKKKAWWKIHKREEKGEKKKAWWKRNDKEKKTQAAPAKEHKAGAREPPHLPRLYQMIFPPRHATSIAFLSWMAPQESVWCVSELAATAVAQIWAAETARALSPTAPPPGPDHAAPKPAYLPPAHEMEAAVDGYHAWWRGQWRREPSIRPGYVRAHGFYRFLHASAGTALYAHLAHPLAARGRALRRRDRALHAWLTRGPVCGHALRLFDTNPGRVPGCGRRAWPGARDAVHDAFETYESFKKTVRAVKLQPDREPAAEPSLSCDSSTLSFEKGVPGG